MRARLALLAVALVVAACDTTAPVRDLTGLDVRTLSQQADALVGTWDLISTTTAGQVGNPMTTPVTRQIVVAAFGADGRVTFTNAGEVREAAYEVRVLDYGNGTQSETPLLVIDDSPTLFGIDGDRLYLDYRPLDGNLMEYARR